MLELLKNNKIYMKIAATVFKNEFYRKIFSV